MKSDRWDAIERVFHAARELQGEDRARFLDRECGEDVSIYRKVEALLHEDEKTEGILNTAALDMVSATLSAGTVLGPYEVLGVAGTGAMGEVYRAHDRRLNRDVAIKALPVELAHNDERLARLQREATLLASVNHPNVAAIYDVVEVSGAAPFLVLEFVEGSTLADLLHKGPLPLDEALRVAHQIAMALEAAHERGIVHRDLKPANIKLTPDRKVKVLDFGLAKALTSDEGALDFLQPGSLSKSDNEFSTFAGTPSYMSPEQVRGVAVDQRADIWAFGCVVYELLTGLKAYEGETVASTVASIVESEPDWTALPARTPLELRRLLHQCLRKNVSERLQHSSELRQRIEASLHSAPAGRLGLSQWHWTVIAAVAVIAVLVGVFKVWNSRPAVGLRAGPQRQVTFQPELELDPAISSDGMSVAYEFQTETRTDIYVRQLAGGEATNVTKNLESIAHVWPRWSPVRSQLAFLAEPTDGPLMGLENEQTIYVVDYPGGTPRPITNASTRGLAWSPDGTKLAFVRNSEIYVISLDGGTPTRIAEARDPNALSWSPDGKWIAYTSGNFTALFNPNYLNNLAPSSIEIVEANGGAPHPLTDTRNTNTSPVWMPDSRSLLFVSNRGGSRDVFQLKLSDSGVPLGEPIGITTGLNALTIDLSRDGRQLSYSLFRNRSNLWSLPVPKSGPVSPAAAHPVTTGSQTIEGVRLSRDGEWIAFDSNLSGNQDIYRMPRRGGGAVQLTKDLHDDFAPSWSKDGKFIAFHSFRNGNRDIFVMREDGTGVQQVTSDKAEERYPDWSPDGRSLTFLSDKTGPQQVYVVTEENGVWGQPRQVTSSTVSSQFPRWSPDGKSLAYIDKSKGLTVISPDGRDLRLLLPIEPFGLVTPTYVAWAPDSQTIYFKATQSGYRGSLWSVPASGGSPKHLVQFDSSRDSPRWEFDTDGKELFFTLAERESDIWVLDLRK